MFVPFASSSQKDTLPRRKGGGMNGAPSSKYSARGHAACRSCRLRKIRCDQTKPACSNCSARGTACSYDSPAGPVHSSPRALRKAPVHPTASYFQRQERAFFARVGQSTTPLVAEAKSRTVPAGQLFSGRAAGGGTRDQVYGTKAYGSGYPGTSGAGRSFPFFFWPLAWGTTDTPVGSASLATDGPSYPLQGGFFSVPSGTNVLGSRPSQPPRGAPDIRVPSVPESDIADFTERSPRWDLHLDDPSRPSATIPAAPTLGHSMHAADLPAAEVNDRALPRAGDDPAHQMPRVAGIRAKVSTACSSLSQIIFLGVPGMYARHAFHLNGKPGVGLDVFFNARVEECKAMLTLDSVLLGVVSANFGHINKSSSAASIAFFSPACLIVSAAHCITLILFLSSLKSDDTLLDHLPDTEGSHWFPWVVLSMPAVWTSWGVILFLVSMFVLTWSHDVAATAGSAIQLGRFPVAVIVTTTVLGLGAICLIITSLTLKRRLFVDNNRTTV